MIRHSRSFTCSRRSDPDLIYQQLAERSLANKDRILFCGSQNSVDFFNQYTFILRVAVTILGHTCSPHTHIKVRETLRYRTRLPVSTLYHLQCRCPCSSNEAEPNALVRHSFASERDSRGIASKDRLPKRRKSISQPCDNPCLSHSITHGERTICATQRLKRLTPVSKHISIFQDWPVCSLPCTSMWISFIILLHLLPCCLSRVATNLPVLTMQAPVRSDVELHESGTMTKYSLNFSHPTTTVPSFPCRHRFRNDVETSALLAENIIVGWPMQMYRRTLGPLYNISLYVTEVLKKPKRSIFPVQEQQLLRIGQFSEYPDPGRCLLNVKMNKEYIFFIRRPDWAGFCQVTQLPVEYTEEAALRVAKILMLGAHPLQMRPLYHADQLEVDEGNDLLLTCRVRGRPTPLISWYHNETEITTPWKSGLRRGIIQNSRNLSKLQLGNLQASDAGNYTCLAENLNGHIRKSVKVIVTPLNTTPATTTTATTTKPKILVHPCHDYCYRGLCYIIDEKPYCRCEPLHFGERCELYYPLPWNPLHYLYSVQRRTLGRARRRQKNKGLVWV